MTSHISVFCLTCYRSLFSLSFRSPSTADAMVTPLCPVGPGLAPMTTPDLRGLKTVSGQDALFIVDEDGNVLLARVIVDNAASAVDTSLVVQAVQMSPSQTMNLTRCTALVTGGAVRVGAAICLGLTRRGATVVIHHRRSAAAAKALAKRIRREGGKAMLVSGALDTEAGVNRILATAFRAAPSLNVIVNNAAVFARQPLLDATGSDYLAAWRVNTLAPILLTRGFAKQFLARKTNASVRGVVVNLLDRRIAAPEPGCAPYMVSKCALAAFTVAAARELAPRIAVNAVAPGPVLTPPGGFRRVREPAGHVPLGRRPTPQDVADAVAFLVGSDSITGQTIFADGGQHLGASV
jgi:NAD(P)-dependent dehydrogenase (short-subunit alcohol dehydrogenase family)